MFSYVFIICLSDHSLTYLLTYRLSYPKSRDAIASKNKINVEAKVLISSSSSLYLTVLILFCY